MEFKHIAVFIIGAAMLYGLFHMINEERSKEDKKPLGCLPIIIISAVVITFWFLVN